MLETEPMNINERRKYIYKMWGRYKKANKAEKKMLLDEIKEKVKSLCPFSSGCAIYI